MAEFIGAGEVQVDSVFKVTLDYEEFYLSEDAARELRDALNAFLSVR